MESLVDMKKLIYVLVFWEEQISTYLVCEIKVYEQRNGTGSHFAKVD
jgi:hypothetical protein